MYEIKQSEDKFTLYELIDSGTRSYAKIAPERGGILIGYGVRGEEVFYLDKDTFYDEKANIRGGNPILFPICAQLKDGKYELNGHVYEMKNHGFARNLPWEVVRTGATDHAFLTMRLVSNEETRAAYPFDFELVFTYVLKDGILSIEQEYHNKTNEKMPMYAGFHPYFKTGQKDIFYQTAARHYLDQNDMEVKRYEGHLDIAPLKESVILLDAQESNIAFEVTDPRRTIRLDYSPEFGYVTIWSQEGKDFVCVEPWMAKTDEMNRKDELYWVEPNGVLRARFSMALEG